MLNKQARRQWIKAYSHQLERKKHPKIITKRPNLIEKLPKLIWVLINTWTMINLIKNALKQLKELIKIKYYQSKSYNLLHGRTYFRKVKINSLSIYNHLIVNQRMPVKETHNLSVSMVLLECINLNRLKVKEYSKIMKIIRKYGIILSTKQMNTFRKNMNLKQAKKWMLSLLMKEL